MKWHNRDKKLRRRRNQKDMGKPFRRELSKDTVADKQLSKLKKKLKRTVEKEEEQDDELDLDNY